MSKKKGSTKKYGKRLDEKTQQMLMGDIRAGLAPKELIKKYKVSEKTIQRYQKKNIAEKKARPPSVLDVKRALEIAKIDTALMYSVEHMTLAQQRIEKEPENYKADKQAKVAQENAKVLLEIRNALVFTDLPPLDAEGYGPEEVDLHDKIMRMFTKEQQEELFESYTGKKIGDYAKPRDDTDSEGQPEAGVLPEKPGSVRDNGAGGKSDS